MNRTVAIHHLLFAIFPTLSLFYHNIKEVPVGDVLLTMSIALVFAIALLLLSKLFLKDNKKSALFVSVFLFVFFSFGHAHQYILRYIHPVKLRFAFIREGYLLFILSLAIIVASSYLIKKTRYLNNITKILNIIATILVVIPLTNTIYFKLNITDISLDDKRSKPVAFNLKDTEKPGLLPSIYYIILDGYARQDVLKEIYQHDNSEFIGYLNQKGFYVAHKSKANYAQSILSLPSSLNFKYINELTDQVGIDSTDWGPLFYLWRHNRVFSFLKQYGYRTVTFDAQGWEVYLRRQDVDILYSTPGVGTMNALQSELVNTTPIPFILQRLLKLSDIRYTFLRKRILNAFDNLERVSKQDGEGKGPFFVFAHLLTPHQPFIFGRNGEHITPDLGYYTEWYTIPDGRNREEYIEQYREQVSFIDRKTQEVIEKIIFNSSVPPIIILQADHGSDANLDPESVENTDQKEKMAILNAYYFPDRDYSDLYETITPVNTFRVIFNNFFGTEYELLEDRCYFSPWTRPYKFTDVTYRVNSD